LSPKEKEHFIYDHGIIFGMAGQDGPDNTSSSRRDFENNGFVTHARIGRQLGLRTVINMV